MTCAIYSNNRDKALQKLEEIREEKGNLISIRNSRYELFYRFEDEIWKWVKPNDSTRGYKPIKCWIDEHSITLKEYHCYILPYLIDANKDDIKYF